MSAPHIPAAPRRRGPFLSTLAAAAAALAVTLGAPQSAGAQTVFHACYVPASGTVYRIKAPSTPLNCLQPTHVAFSWTDGAGGGGGAGVSAHGALTGLGNDDHGQYVLTTGRRLEANGLVLQGNEANGLLPSFDNTRPTLLWYPARSTFRAGMNLENSMASANLGTNSAAFGLGTIASASESFAAGNQTKATGVASTAFGAQTVASGQNSFAAGNASSASASGSIAIGDGAKAIGKGAVVLGRGTATGENAFAAGNGSAASALAAVALGNSNALGINSFAAAQGDALAQNAVALDGYASGHASFAAAGGFATGDRSIAMGVRASTNEKVGAMVLTDNLAGGAVNAARDQQFVARFERFWFGRGTNVTDTPGYLIETSVGARLSNGGTWETVSDSTKKTAFTPVDAEDVLVKLAGIGMQTWQYSAESDSVRHMGPTAQAFRAAFGLGASERSIATVDADGVALVAAQALEKRTSRLKDETVALRAENAQLSERLAQLEALVARLTATPRER